MPINPIGGMSPFGNGGFGPSAWIEFNKLVAQFWQLLEAGELAEAAAVLQKMFALSRGAAALMATYESCLAAFETVLAVAAGTVRVVGGVVTLPETGIILCIAVISIYVIGGGCRFGTNGGNGSVAWQPHPIKNSEEFEEIARMIFKHPHRAGGLISAPKHNYRSPQAQAAAAGLLLSSIRALRGA